MNDLLPFIHASAVVVHCVHGAQKEPPAVGFWHKQHRTSSMSPYDFTQQKVKLSQRQGCMLTFLAGVAWSRLRGTCPESKLGAQLCLRWHWGSSHIPT